MLHLTSPKFIILGIYIASVAYTQFRGKVRLKFMRQLINHSTFIAPLNALMYLFSKLPNQPFYPVDQFKELQVLTDNWQIIREEAQQLFGAGMIKSADADNDMGFNSFFKRGWRRFYIKWYENFLPSAQTMCPKTVALLKSVPNIHGAMFTMLPKGGGRLKAHRDPYAGSLRYHLGLVTPNSEQCYIYVDGIPYYWKDGEAVIFDETYIHRARNDSDMDRIILFCDVERPLNNKIMTFINRVFCKYIMSESATQNLPTDKVGALNKFYRYYKFLADTAIRVKKFNKPTFRILQYAGIAGLFYLLFF